MATTVDKVLVATTYTTSGEHAGTGPPSGKLWVVKDISVNTDGGSGTQEVAVYTRRSGSNWNIADNTALGNNPANIHWSGWRVLEFGDTLGLYQSTNRNAHLWASGVEITP